MWAKYNGSKWEMENTMWKDDDIEDYSFTKGGSAPKGDSSDILYQSRRSTSNKMTVVKSHPDFKTFAAQLTSTSDNRTFKGTAEFMVRDKDMYKKFLDGYELETKSVMWFKDSDEVLKDDEGDKLKFNKATTAEKALVSSSSKYNLKSGSTPYLTTDCSPTNSGSKECNGSICSANSECQSNYCKSKICTYKAPVVSSTKRLSNGAVCTKDNDC